MQKPIFFLIIALLALSHFLYPQAKETKQYQVEAETDGHKAMAVITTKPFDPKHHRIEMKREGNGSYCSKVDGRTPLGEDGGVP